MAYIQDDSKHNEAGVLFKHRALLLKDNPEHLFVMRYRLCCSFPLHDIIAFHREKERECEKMQAERAKHNRFMVDQDLNTTVDNLALITAVTY